jgi:hypothetical protein
MALYSGNSTWTSVKVWDTKVGVGQIGNTCGTAPTSDKQAATAAFLLDLTGIVSRRFWQLWYTRAWDPDGDYWSMFCSDISRRPSKTIWTDREASYTDTGSACP